MNETSGYQAAYSTAAYFDHSAEGKVEVSGADAPAFLTNLSTNDLRELPLGGGCETYFLDHKAKTLFHTLAYHVLNSDGQHAIWLDTTPGRGPDLYQHLDRYLISEAVELSDRTSEYSQFHIVGPSANTVLQRLLHEAIPSLELFQHMIRTFNSRLTLSIRRTDRVSQLGYDLVLPKSDHERFAELLASHGASPGTEEDYEILRIEAGVPVYGKDIDASRFVLELPQVGRAISYTKGCFIGQEPIIMSRDRAGFVNRQLVRLKCESSPLPPGTSLQRDGQEVGVSSSSAISPRFGPIALGYLRRGHQDPGTILTSPSGTVEVLGAF